MMETADVKANFKAQGITVRQWAKDNDFNPRTVYAVLQGKIKGQYGESHKIAVALGIKPRPANQNAA